MLKKSNHLESLNLKHPIKPYKLECDGCLEYKSDLKGYDGIDGNPYVLCTKCAKQFIKEGKVVYNE